MTNTHIIPQSIRKVRKTLPPVRITKYAEYEKQKNGISAAEIIVI